MDDRSAGRITAAHPWAQRPSAAGNPGLTVYGAEPDEVALFQELAPGFGVLPTIVAEPVTEQNARLAAGTRCVSIGHKTGVSNAALLTLRRAGVEYLSTRSIGFNHLDLAYAQQLGLAVGNVAYSPDSVADYTLMLILMTLRQAKSMVRRTDAHDYRLNEVRGKELRDLTVGVVGTGRIGNAVIERLRGFGCRILTSDKRATGPVRGMPLEDLLRHSDIVTLHLPLTAETQHLLDCERIGMLKPGAYLINTGRGGLLDTEALASALASGKLGGAALDVVEGEERIFYTDHGDRPPENQQILQLQKLPNVLISPHTAYYTDHALRDIVEDSLNNCLIFERRNRNEQDQSRNSLRRLVGGAFDLRQVGTRSGEEPGYRKV